MSTPKGDSRLVEKTTAVYVTFFFTVPASDRQAAVLFVTC